MVTIVAVKEKDKVLEKVEDQLAKKLILLGIGYHFTNRITRSKIYKINSTKE
jgi:hypothetical protein